MIRDKKCEELPFLSETVFVLYTSHFIRYITPFVMNFLLGETGGYLLLTMLMMARMSTGSSGEVMAISSIVVYDIYKTYINTFSKKKNLSPSSCVLCGRQKQLSELKMDGDFCACSSLIGCKSCDVDIITRARVGVDKVAYTCSVYGDNRRYEDGLMRYKNCSLLTAMLVGFVVSGVGCVIVSLCTHNIRSEVDANLEWAKTIYIDNPINPFRLMYVEEFTKAEVGDIITPKAMDKVFRKAKLYDGVLGIISLVMFVIVVLAIALSSGVLSFDEFSACIKGYQICCFICTFVVVVLPPFDEGYQIWLRYQKNKRNETSSVCTAKEQDFNEESCKL
ncbi:DUR3-like protein [Mya arenaria]|uniref:DUR3-like protein n=1 Tax=Mya arenaria TaxID=6604 RepID=A0ABY7DRH0_MYAAR|nr:DUR3-like protein [Mya arenaria]